LRVGAAAARRSGGGDGRGRRLESDALASLVFVISRDICSWPALSAAMLAFNCSICCPIVATSRAIDWINCVWSEAEDGAAPASEG
jgi:hypothetical protein